jgi:hypothetical protein
MHELTIILMAMLNIASFLCGAWVASKGYKQEAMFEAKPKGRVVSLTPAQRIQAEANRKIVKGEGEVSRDEWGKIK